MAETCSNEEESLEDNRRFKEHVVSVFRAEEYTKQETSFLDSCFMQVSCVVYSKT
jgi:hypothetical protein